MSSGVADLWGPSFAGLVISLAMYGTSVGQYIYYVISFPGSTDLNSIKAFVFSVMLFNTVHTYVSVAFFWMMLVSGHNSFTHILLMPWQLAMVLLCYCITFIVQSFYAHKVWIISGRSWFVTAIVLALAAAQMVVGSVCVSIGLRTQSTDALFGSRLSGAGALLSVFCDTLITGVVYYYLRPKRWGVRRKESVFRHLTMIFVQMGLLTCMTSLLMFILFCVQGQKLYTGGPGVILSKSYVNSLLAVLNARKTIRDRRKAHITTIELPTIPVSSDSTSTTDI
ncbi:hypothetical protein BJ138DRAFT_178544 [Hygrophoropsis aurantiaca]|uniref:Uncharacterized protein n=1 Tax=Hygrophoropsis aurantiaca TaxID=72124 RepID=A0ACB8A8Y8_9AGAM|nr:hypothetical protein BJ138DRAFT_178544 [Hygrophoropsis aurantiaca]